MCDDLTRQEILFYTVIQSRPEGMSEDEIFDGMGALAKKLGWPKDLSSVPRPLTHRLLDASARHMIEKIRPLRWRALSGVGEYVRELVERFLDEAKPEQRQLILDELHDDLHPAE